MVPAAHVEGCTAASTTTRRVDDPFSRELLAQYDALYPGAREVHRRQRVLGPLSRAAAVGGRREEAGSLAQDDVIAALDHAQIAEGPGGPADMVPGQHHVRHAHVHRARHAAAGSRSSQPRGDRSAGAGARRCVAFDRCNRRPAPRRAGRRRVCRPRRYWIASATCGAPIASTPARSAIVRASLRMRWIGARREVELRDRALAAAPAPRRRRTQCASISARIEIRVRLALPRRARVRVRVRRVRGSRRSTRPRAATSNSSSGTAGTSTCMSMRSSSGPESLPR